MSNQRNASPPRSPRGSGPSRIAAYKAAQRARIAEEHGIDELRRRRRLDQQRDRLLMQLRIEPRDGRVVPRHSRRRHRPSGLPIDELRSMPVASIAPVLFRVFSGASFSDLSDSEQEAYAFFIWLTAWNISWTLAFHGRDVMRKMRRRLLTAAQLVNSDPGAAVRRLVRIGFSAAMDVLATGATPEEAYSYSSLALVVYCHLRNSDIYLPDIESILGRWIRLLTAGRTTPAPPLDYRLTFGEWGLSAENYPYGPKGVDPFESLGFTADTWRSMVESRLCELNSLQRPKPSASTVTEGVTEAK